MAALVPGKVEVTVPPGVAGGDTINVNAAGQLISCRVPDGMREGDKFQVQPATQPVVQPIPVVPEGVVIAPGDMLPHEKACLDMRYSTRIIAIVDVVLTLINLWAGGFWFLVCLIGAICGFIGAHIYNSCLVLVYVVFAWVWVAGLILNIIVVTIFFFANRHEFSWVEGSFTAWYIAFMVWSLILLVVRVYIAGFVHKFFNALQSVGDDRAKELGEHSNYDQKCVVVP